MRVWIWLVIGLGVGLVQVLTQWWTVNRLRPGTRSAALRWIVIGALGRWMVTAAVLLLALSTSISAGLLAFAGWWLGRWPLIIWLSR